MADRIKDAEDRALEALFASAPIDDDGFSARIVSRVRRRVWVRRLALPTAAILGGAIALKPVVAVVTGLTQLAGVLPVRFTDALAIDIPQLSTWLVVTTLAVCAMLVLPEFDD